MSFRNQTLRTISSLVLLCYLSLVTLPLQAAVQQEVFARPKPNTDNSTPISQLEQMRELTRKLAMMQGKLPASTAARTKALALQQQQEKTTANELLKLQTAVLQEAAEQDTQLQLVEAHIKDKKLPDTILQRHQTIMKQLQDRRQQLQTSLQQLAKANDNTEQRRAALKDLSLKLEQWGGEQAQKTDSKHLPWGSPSNKVRAPLGSKQAYIQHLDDVLGVKPLQVAGLLPSDMVWQVLPNLSETPTPEDTAANEDVQITPAIQALAAQLNHNPAQIYKWVYDYIEYIPTYGSIQGADFTLQSKRGNAFDTASLLIALLRASGIASRYVYGTIEVPTNYAMNWVGGVTSPDAAQNLLGQGGIPNVAMTQGGQTIAIRMEHVWVEAFIDFFPSRGAVNKIPDSWIPLDASYKNYQYQNGQNLQQAVPFDAQALVNDLQSTATIDPQGNYVQNIDQNKVQTALTNYQQRLQSYLQQQPNATVGDILGKRTIKIYPSRGLASNLQYKTVAVAGDYHTLPDTMRHYFTVQIFQNSTEKQLNEPSFTVKLSTPKLAGQRLALSFKPSTAADEQTINSYLPQPHADGTPIQPSELPQSMAGYLIHLTPELTLNGDVLKSAGEFMMGQEVETRLGYLSPNNSQQPLVTKIVRAGEYHAIGIDLQGMSQEQLSTLKTQLEVTKSKFESQDTNQFATLTKHHLTGAILQTGVQSYFALNDMQDSIASSQVNVVTNRFMSFGTFSTNIQPNLKYGFPLSARFAGMMMDIDRLFRQVTDKNNDRSKTIAFVSSQGARQSANEHLVPEQLFDDPNTPVKDAEAISAVKALQLAAQAGQKIFTITKSNINTVLPQLQQKSLIVSDIQNAVNAGKVVTISQSGVSYNGWIGAGYTIIDPQTGAGAYLIAGGADGAVVRAIQLIAVSLATIMGSLIDQDQASSAPSINTALARAGQLVARAAPILTLVIQIMQIWSHPEESIFVKSKQTGAAILATFVGSVAGIAVGYLAAGGGIFLVLGLLMAIILDVIITVNTPAISKRDSKLEKIS